MNKSFLSAIKDSFLNMIFPKHCLGCGLEGSYLCSQCLDKIDLNKTSHCALCKKPTEYSELCSDCRQGSGLDGVWVAADYNGEVLQKLIHSYKYQYIEELADVLAKLLNKYIQENNKLEQSQMDKQNTVISCVPLHRKRLLKRGFNQSRLLATRLALLADLQYADLLIRQKNTPSQVNFKRAERQANVRQAFICKPELEISKNKKIIIIDDVLTTGSTLAECSKILRNNGFSTIYGLVIAQRED